MNTTPDQALVLAAGYGTRLAPLTNIMPKALVPLWDKPILVHVLELLRDWGVKRAVINAHHLADHLAAFVAAQPIDNMELLLSYEPKILGTGGALRAALPLLENAPLWMVNADLALDCDPAPLLKAFNRPERPAAVLAFTRQYGPRTVDLCGSTIKNFISATPGSEHTATFCGLQLMHPEVAAALPEKAFCSVVDAYSNLLSASNAPIAVEPEHLFWADLGTPDRLLDAHAAVKAAHDQNHTGARLFNPAHDHRAPGFAAVADDVELAPTSYIEASMVCRGAHLGPTASCKRAIIGPDCRVNGQVTGLVLNAKDALSPAEQALLPNAELQEWAAEILPGRGSDRSFVRLHDDLSTVMLVRHGAERRENSRYCGHAKLLAQAGVPVPAVLAEQTELGISLWQDLGSRSVQDVWPELGPAERRQLVGDMSRVVAHFHTVGLTAVDNRELEPRFDAALYTWEHGLFEQHFLKPRFEQPVVNKIRTELREVTDRLVGLPDVLVHRDLQSSNLLLHNASLYFIDFQGMRRGPAAYDLASMLYDPYIEMSDELREAGRQDYAAAVGCDLSTEELALAAVQRLSQALGAYGRLSTGRSTARFAAYIPAGQRLLLKALQKSTLPEKGLLTTLLKVCL